MKIKINETNREAINAALKKINGKATEHTFVDALSVIYAARDAEAQLENLGLSKGSRSGAIAIANSGGSVTNSYKYTRITTTVTLVRGSSAWFLVSIEASETYRRKAGELSVSLTDAQDTEVTLKFRAQYFRQTFVVGGAA